MKIVPALFAMAKPTARKTMSGMSHDLHFTYQEDYIDREVKL